MRIAAMSLAAVVGALFWVAPATSLPAGCSVNVTYKNVDTEELRVRESLSQVKIKGGWWALLGGVDLDIGAGDYLVRTYRLDFGCGVKRRYKFAVYGTHGSKTIYYPSSSGWTTSQSFTVRMSI